jgi:hypothetical protein
VLLTAGMWHPALFDTFTARRKSCPSTSGDWFRRGDFLSSLRDLRCFPASHPRLTPWAAFFRPFGTWCHFFAAYLGVTSGAILRRARGETSGAGRRRGGWLGFFSAWMGIRLAFGINVGGRGTSAAKAGIVCHLYGTTEVVPFLYGATEAVPFHLWRICFGGEIFFRPSGACGVLRLVTHGLRRGLHSFAASRLRRRWTSIQSGVRRCGGGTPRDSRRDAGATLLPRRRNLAGGIVTTPTPIGGPACRRGGWR